MFNYKQFLYDILNGIPNAPYAYGFYKGTSTTWVVALVYNVQGTAWEDDVETATRYSVVVNVFSKSDNASVVEEVKTRMLANGCTRVSENDFFDTATGYIQTTINFQFERMNQ